MNHKHYTKVWLLLGLFLFLSGSFLLGQGNCVRKFTHNFNLNGQSYSFDYCLTLKTNDISFKYTGSRHELNMLEELTGDKSFPLNLEVSNFSDPGLSLLFVQNNTLPQKPIISGLANNNADIVHNTRPVLRFTLRIFKDDLIDKVNYNKDISIKFLPSLVGKADDTPISLNLKFKVIAFNAQRKLDQLKAREDSIKKVEQAAAAAKITKEKEDRLREKPESRPPNEEPRNDIEEEPKEDPLLIEAKDSPIVRSAVEYKNNGYEIKLENVIDVQVDSTSSNIDSNQINISSNEEDYSATLVINGMGRREEAFIRLIDTAKLDLFEKEAFVLGQYTIPSIEFNEDSTGILSINFTKGKAPYVIYFNSSAFVYTIEKEGDLPWKPEEDFFVNNKLLGEVRLSFSDATNEFPYSEAEWKIRVPEPPNKLLPYFIGIISALFLFVILIPTIRKALSRRRRKVFQASRSKNLHTLTLERIKANKEALKNAATAMIEEGGNEFEDKEKLKIKAAENSKIKIKKITKATQKPDKTFDEKILDKIIKAEEPYEFDTSIFWENTRVSSVFFTEKAMDKLDRFLDEQNLKPLIEQEGQIPEIGGILLGRPFLSQNNKKYRVLVEEFVPINPEYHDTYQLEFSAESLAQDLGRIQDQYPELQSVGWFHTHPGHGLFLSKPDLRIQDTFFVEAYQFAMEIDSLTKRLDTGFFTRMDNGKINNKRNLKPNTLWHSWLEIEHKV